MRFVAIKTVEQQQILTLHRVRAGLIKQRTACGNPIHALLLEFGISLPKGKAAMRRQLTEVLEDGDNALPDGVRVLLARLREHFRYLSTRIEQLDRDLAQRARHDEACQRLMTIPGVGPVGATQRVAAIGDAHSFRNARELAAWLGLVPRQYSTGGRARLLGISKRGDTHLRTVLIHGARAILRFARRKADGHRRWIQRLLERRSVNVVVVAIANKTARIAWALLMRGGHFEPERACASA